MWTPTEDEKIGVVICNFRGSVNQGLALEVGETVHILEKCEGWYRGFSARKPNVKVRINYRRCLSGITSSSAPFDPNPR